MIPRNTTSETGMPIRVAKKEVSPVRVRETTTRIENLKAFRDGRVSHNKPKPADEFSYQDSTRATECPAMPATIHAQQQMITFIAHA